VKLVAANIDLSDFLVRDFGAGWIDAVVQFGVNQQTRLGRCSGNETHDDLVAEKRPPAPVLRDDREKPVLDLVPLAGARREVVS